MYTRCPSCRAEISFAPPANLESLPDGYKHRIKCPSCGVTIGVKIPKVASDATVYSPQNPYATTAAPVFSTTTVLEEIPSTAAAPAVAKKKPGTARNVVMMIFSLLLVAFSVVGYLVSAGVLDVDFLAGTMFFEGISGFDVLVNNTETFVTMLQGGIENIIVLLAPMALFVLAGINFIVAFIAACGKKYARAWFVISSLLVLAFGAAPFICNCVEFGVDFFKGIFSIEGCMWFVGVVICLLQFIFSLCFTASLKKKA